MTDRPDPADWIANARSLTQSSSIPLGVPVNTHMDMLLRDTRRDLQAACDALEAVLELTKEHRAFATKRGRDDCICTICDMCRAIESALRGDS